MIEFHKVFYVAFISAVTLRAFPNISDLLDIYLKKIEADYRGGIATELTHRSSLENLLEALEPGIVASSDPQHIDCGAPDFIVEKGKIPLGYVETKDIGVDLNKIEKTDQLKRYLKALNNLILTDYLEFRWYVNGELRLKTHIAETGAGGRLTAIPEGMAGLESLPHEFYRVEVPTVRTPKDLATRLAEHTHLVRDLIVNALRAEDKAVSAALDRQLETFRQVLLPNLTESEFADLYAQTMAYGLFAAKLSAPEDAPFGRAAAYQYLTSNRFLRRLFLDVGEELDGTLIVPFLDDIAALLARADFASILADFGRRTRTEDPVVHFYETFLAQYDPKLRESRGVYYTPEPVVSFIVRSVDWLLKEKFGVPRGLADEDVKILDPATGTGTFLYYVIQQVYESLHESGQAGLWPASAKGLLKRIFGFELLMAPYVVSHLKLGLQFQSLGAPLDAHERLGIYLTNTLEESVTKSEMLESLSFYIAEEAGQAAQIKKSEPIMVVLGNPPYSGHSANKGEWIDGLLREYYFVDGAPLGERNPKWLQDDYVKFIRFGEWRISQTGHGVLAFITNHGYLDNPTFRGMRQHLMKTFDEIYLLDLHGNSKKKEVAPDGGKDENVFDIQQGVAIILAVKNQISEALPDQVYHADLWGTRNKKYALLKNNDLNKIQWSEIKPTSPFYLFFEQNANLLNEYELGWKITDIFPINVLGFQSHRDAFAIDFDQSTVATRIREMRDNRLSDLEFRRKYSLKDNRDWKLTEARLELRRLSDWQTNLVQCDYRPFDKRWIYFDEIACDYPRSEVTRHLLLDNLALNLVRQTKAEYWQHALVSDKPTPAVFVEIKDGSSIFPLYLYTTPEDTAGTLFAQSETTRKPNLSPRFIEEFSEKLGLNFINDGQGDLKSTFGPEDIFYYAYAVFHSPAYRERYAEFLKIDFPRLPLTSDKKLFAKLVKLGKQLVDFHLLRTPKVEKFITTFPVAGDNTVDKPRFAPEPSEGSDPSASSQDRPSEGLGRVWINKSQYFGDVPEGVWNFKVGGYQVCEKWLKDRKKRALSSDEVLHYQRVVVALKETMRLMGEVDDAIESHGGWPVE
jgi:hypothetical protein